MAPSKLKVTVVGSGNWGSSIARICGQNTLRYPETFDPKVRMWVFEEQINGKNLTEIINEKHENVKYLPGTQLGDNVIAISDIKEAAKDANILVFVLPHQFVYQVCESLCDIDRNNCIAISLIKGLEYKKNDLLIFSEEIEKMLGIHCAALSGANIADEVANEQFSESTIASRDYKYGELFLKLFHTDYFDCNVIGDWRGLQICGALKNIVALGAGISDGLGYGNNAKSAIIRRGLVEMRTFGKTFFGGVHTETFFESCGVADLITTCAGGRNRKFAAAFIKSDKSIEQVEKEILNGQKVQGTTTAKEVHSFLSARNMTQEFPLMTAIYRIIYERAPPESITLDLRTRKANI